MSEPAVSVARRLKTLMAHWSLDEQRFTAALEARLLEGKAEDAWLILAAVLAEVPSLGRLREFRRLIALNGASAAIAALIAEASHVDRIVDRGIEIVEAATLVDVHDTVGTRRTSGIQRVVRETMRRWVSRDDVIPVAWTTDGHALRRLQVGETAALVGEPAERPEIPADVPALIPVGGRFVVMELVAEVWRARRLQGLGAHPGLELSVLGYDCVPLTSGETSSEGIAQQFPLYLQAIATAERVAAISVAAATEFRGWARMVAGASGVAPAVAEVSLAAEVAPATDEDRVRAAVALGLRSGEPMVLVVGSHEPRKNHLAVLAAAERLWRDGARFRLCFIGATSWNSERFHREAARLARRHPLTVLTAADDGLLSAAYGAAAFTVFPSLHEGFGLPVAESLALGIPVITSDFGSMREIVEDGGGLLVNPRDDRALAAAMGSLLSDDGLRERLAFQARARPVRSWDAYADDLWRELVLRNS